MLEAASPLDAETVPLGAAVGRVLAEPIVASRLHPPRDDSAMDGYAVRVSDARGASAARPARLRVAETAAVPGMPTPPELRPGEAVRILTGGPVPPGADAVVRQEAVRLDGDAIILTSEPEAGSHIRRAGEDFAPGQPLLQAGTVLGPGEVTALAAMGRPEVRVVRRPVVAILTTGDELRSPGEPLGPGEIYDSNAAGLTAMVIEAGGVPVALERARDDAASLRAALSKASSFDVLVTAAGISVGDRDLVADVLSGLGAAWRFRGVRMRPGHPASFATLGERLVFGLPGNPAACLVAFEVLARPALRRMAGFAQADRARETALLEKPLQKKGGSVLFVRGVARRRSGILHFRPLDRQGVGMITSMIGHNALAALPAERTSFAAGDRVEVMLLGEPVGEEAPPPPLVAFVGRSGSGKTSLLCRLLPALAARGLRVAVLKHDAHGFELDHEGKDTWRLTQAGAASVALVGAQRVGAVLGERGDPIEDLARRLFPDADLVLAEGFHGARCPKVLVLDARGPEARDLAVQPDLLATVGGRLEGIRAFSADEVEGLADLLSRWRSRVLAPR